MKLLGKNSNISLIKNNKSNNKDYCQGANHFLFMKSAAINRSRSTKLEAVLVKKCASKTGTIPILSRLMLYLTLYELNLSLQIQK